MVTGAVLRRAAKPDEVRSADAAEDERLPERVFSAISQALLPFDQETRRQIAQLTAGHRRALMTLAAVSMLAALAPLLYPIVLLVIVNGVVQQSTTMSIPAALAALVGIAVTSGLARYFAAVRAARLAATMRSELQLDLYDAFQRMPIAFFREVNAGAVLSRQLDESFAAGGLAVMAVEAYVPNIAVLATATLAVALLEPAALLGLVTFLAILPILRRLDARVRLIAREEVQSLAEVTSYAEERLNAEGNMLITVLGDHDREHTRFADLLSSLHGVYTRLGSTQAAMSASLSSIVGLGVVVVVLLILVDGGTGRSVGTLLALLLYLRLLEQPVAALLASRIPLTRAAVSLRHVREVLDWTVAGPEPTAIVPAVADPLPEVPAPAGGLRFRSVTYAYPERSTVAPASLTLRQDNPVEALPALHDVEIDVAEGELVALVGPSGAGKSTIALLAAGLAAPTAGAVTLGGVELTAMSPRERARRVSIVSQDSHFFHDTLRQNILLARPEATEKEFTQACVAAGVHSFAWNLPRKYGTVMGQRGLSLSGGERQRVALARALLSDPDLLVLDEATGQLDSLTEQSVERAVQELFRSKSRLVIAHRLATVLAADRIYVVAEGRVVAAGRHEELCAVDGLYRSMVEAQRFAHQ